jgi:hypothetical protein
MENRFERFVIHPIESLEDVKRFAMFLIDDLHLNFHPDDDFSFYVGKESWNLNTTEAAQGNKLMDQCFEVCEKEHTDIYEIMGTYLFAALKEKA